MNHTSRAVTLGMLLTQRGLLSVVLVDVISLARFAHGSGVVDEFAAYWTYLVTPKHLSDSLR